MEGGVTLGFARDLLALSGISWVEEGDQEQVKVNKSNGPSLKGPDAPAQR